MGIAADFVLIVVAGLFGAIVARWLRLPLLVGYVAAGIMVGPYTAGPTVAQIRDIELLAEVGVALLLFSLGLELSIADLAPVRRVALVGGTLQMVLTTVAAAWLGMAWLGLGWIEATWLGAIVSVSSTMVVLKTLAAAGVTRTLASKVMIGLLVLQDLAVIPMLIILPQLSQPEGIVRHVLQSTGLAVVILALTVFTGSRLIPLLLKRILDCGSRELFLVAVVAVGIGLGYALHAVGLSFALGAFIAGLVLSESEFSHQALSEIAPLRDIFGLLFFVTVGMLFDPQFAARNAGLIAASVLTVLIGKALVLGPITRAFGYRNDAPWIVALGLAQIGEFSFVLAREGLRSGAVGKEIYDLALSITVITMAVSPMVANLALPLARVFRRERQSNRIETSGLVPESAVSGHVIVAGYGRTGKAATRVLAAAGVPLIVIEQNHALWTGIGRAGITGILGDFASPEILHAAGIARARLLIIAVPGLAAARLCIGHATRVNPNIAVIARAASREHVPELFRLDVAGVVQPEFEGAVAMARQALSQLEIDSAIAENLVEEARAELYSGYPGTG